MRKVFTVKGYDVSGGRSAASFKLDLRLVCKEFDLYFKQITEGIAKGYAKNVGQLLFGVPDRWKGIFGMRYTEEDVEKVDIEILLDYRAAYTEYENEMIELLEKGLNKLKDLGIIEDYS